MRKIPVGWTLSPETVENVRAASEAEHRSMSQWADIHFTEYFAKHPVKAAN